MTARKPKSEHKKPTAPKKPARKPGWLWCDSCNSRIPYQGFGTQVEDGSWPTHRCVNHTIKSFDRWTKDGPEMHPWAG